MPTIEKVSIALTGEQITALKAAVEAGEYATTSEVVREAIRDWQWKRDLRNGELEGLRTKWNDGKASGTPTSIDLSSTRDEARKRLKKASSNAA